MLEEGGILENVPQINYPPLFVESDHLEENALEKDTVIYGVRVAKKTLFFMEWYLSNIAGVLFIVGSFLFNPIYSRDTLRWAAILFIIGSFLFMVSAFIIFIRNNCHTFEDKSMTYNCLLYICANGLFLVGSVFFLPSVEEDRELLITGLFFFVVGSGVFFTAPFYSVYRLLSSNVGVKKEYVFAEIAVACLFIAGNAMFLIGSILFLPYKFNSDDFNYAALQLFIVGSFCFFLATFVLTIKQGVEEIGLVFCYTSTWFRRAIFRKKKGARAVPAADEEAAWTDRGSGSSEIEVDDRTVSTPSATWKLKESMAAPPSTTATESPLFSGTEAEADEEDAAMRAFVPRASPPASSSPSSESSDRKQMEVDAPGEPAALSGAQA